MRHGAVPIRAQRPVPGQVVRSLSVLQALHWAFGREHAALDFEDNGSGAARLGVSTVWVMMQRGQLGCQIDGGGRSHSHDDADVIAAILEAMPHELGGRAMAVQIAGLARAGLAPDWMKGARPRCVPVAWRNTKHGPFAKTAVVGIEVYQHRGREIRIRREACPVRYIETHEQISAARGHYLDWWGALLWLRQELSGAGLRSIVITREMPVISPWHRADPHHVQKTVDLGNIKV